MAVSKFVKDYQIRTYECDKYTNLRLLTIMNILQDKSKKDYNYTSRYSSFPFYYNTKDKKYMYGITNNLSQQAEYVIHYVEDTDDLDKLALKYYGRPDLY
jgi:hypothetical protein